MRTGITITGIIVLILGLIVAGMGAYYVNVASEWVGGVVAIIGLIAGLAAAAMATQVAKTAT